MSGFVLALRTMYIFVGERDVIIPLIAIMVL